MVDFDFESAPPLPRHRGPEPVRGRRERPAHPRRGARCALESAPDAVVGDRRPLRRAHARCGRPPRCPRNPRAPGLAMIGEFALGHNAAAARPRRPVRATTNSGAELLAGARVVLLQLPRSLNELDEIAALIAAARRPRRRGLRGRPHQAPHPGDERRARQALRGRVGVARPAEVARAGRARSRADAPASEYPQREYHDELDLWVCAHGGAFAGTKLDIGTRYLLRFLREMKPDARTAVDLGCGTGILAAAIARSRPGGRRAGHRPVGAAVASARATAEANDLPSP
jgi:16S rRNA (guanine1207-N2)-methyltransferase